MTPDKREFEEERKRERRRLQQVYAGMTDEELLNIADDMNGLTEVAREVMTEELAKRGLRVAPVFEVEGEILPPADVNLVTVAHYMHLGQAWLAKSALDSAGITSFLLDENATRLYWANVTGGIRLQVDATDAELARAILEEPIPEELEVDGLGKYQQSTCPSCGGLDVDHLAGDPYANRSDCWECRQCGCEWSVDADEAESG
jgi:Putative prokaryotic signal transducing protein